MIGWPNDEGLPKVKEGRRPRLGARTHAGQLTRNTGLFIHVTRNTDSVHHLPSTIDAILVLLLLSSFSSRIRMVVKGREEECLLFVLALRLCVRRRRRRDLRYIEWKGLACCCFAQPALLLEKRSRWRADTNSTRFAESGVQCYVQKITLWAVAGVYMTAEIFKYWIFVSIRVKKTRSK